jgi:hypothetical protein
MKRAASKLTWGCPVCEAEFRRFEHAATGIGFAIEEAEAPEYLRDLLNARIDREPQIPSTAAMPENKEKTKTAEKKLLPQPAPKISTQAERKRSGILP